jgi:hypothetical protein
VSVQFGEGRRPGPNDEAAGSRPAAFACRCGLLSREPAVGIEPTTARLRIGCSTTELRWRAVDLLTVERGSNMPWRGLEPRRLSAPPPQDGVSTNFTTRAFTGESGMGNRESKEPRHAREARHWRVVIFRLRFPIPYSRFPLVPTGLTGLEPATSGVTDRHSNQAELQPQLHIHCLTTSTPNATRRDSPNGNRTRLSTLKGSRPNR